MPGDYESVPTDEGAGSSSHQSPNRQPSNWLERTQQWIAQKAGSTKGERAPLIDRSKGTLELPRQTGRKIVVTVVTIILVIVVVGVAVAILTNSNPDDHPAPPAPLDPRKEVIQIPSAESVRGFLQKYTSEPHLAGTEADRRQAEWTRDKWLEFGIEDVEIETYYPLLNYPLEQRLALVSGPKELRFEASLKEDVVDEDETSKDPEAVPTFHGYSKSGKARGPVVYANYGRLEDFEYLRSQGIQLNGTIALMRYGGSFRGLKVRAAETYGCIGALVYSDPIDDGPLDKEGPPHVNPAKSYPEGPWRSPSSAQRGSVQFLSLLAGDPLTPGYAATKDAERIDRDDAVGLAKIPSLPLAYRDALPLLKATQGRGVIGQVDWAGGLADVDYYSGPTEGNVELVNLMDDKITPIWNVVGRIEGNEEPEHAIILGNHRDAWVYGAVDPSSGSAAMLEVVRSLGQLLSKGWRPRRTIILASWDAEEFGLVGSTEWVEDHRDWLSEHAAVYVNVDMGVGGPLFMAKASPSLSQVLYDVTREVTDPRSGNSVYQAWAERTPEKGDVPVVGQLGSGSDFVGFLNHIGIASVDLAFEGDYGVYHSNYDSFHWMEKFGDPTFEYHEAIAKIWSLLAVRLADDRILPLYPGDYASELAKYVETLTGYANSAAENSQVNTTSEFSALSKSVHKLAKKTRRFERRRGRLEERLKEFVGQSDDELPSVVVKRLNKANKRLTFFERGFASPDGIPSRPWFKHVVYAPGLWTGYSSEVFPAIVEGIDAHNEEQTREAEKQAAASIYRAAEWLKVD